MNNSYRKLFSADYHLGKEAWKDIEYYKLPSPVWNADRIYADYALGLEIDKRLSFGLNKL